MATRTLPIVQYQYEGWIALSIRYILFQEGKLLRQIYSPFLQLLPELDLLMYQIIIQIFVRYVSSDGGLRLK